MKRVGAGIAILCCALILGGVYTNSAGSGTDRSSDEFLSRSTSPSTPDVTGTTEEEKEQIANSQEPITGDVLPNSVDVQSSEEQPEHDLAVERMEGMITDDLPSVTEAILAHAKFEVIGDTFPDQLMEPLQDAIPDMLPPLLELLTTSELDPLQAAQATQDIPVAVDGGSENGGGVVSSQRSDSLSDRFSYEIFALPAVVALFFGLALISVRRARARRARAEGLPKSDVGGLS